MGSYALPSGFSQKLTTLATRLTIFYTYTRRAAHLGLGVAGGWLPCCPFGFCVSCGKLSVHEQQRSTINVAESTEGIMQRLPMKWIYLCATTAWGVSEGNRTGAAWASFALLLQCLHHQRDWLCCRLPAHDTCRVSREVKGPLCALPMGLLKFWSWPWLLLLFQLFPSWMFASEWQRGWSPSLTGMWLSRGSEHWLGCCQCRHCCWGAISDMHRLLLWPGLGKTRQAFLSPDRSNNYGGFP